MTDRPALLLIDDSTSVREVLRVALESEGYQVLELRTGDRDLAVNDGG